MGAAVFLELLARDAAVVEYERPLVEARARRAPAAEIDELELAKRYALQVRATLERRRQREAELVALFDTAGEIAALQDLDAVLQAIVRRSRRLLGTDVAYLTLKDPDAGDTYMRVTDGSVAASFQRLRLPLGVGLGGLVAQTATPYSTPNYPKDLQFRHTEEIDTAVRDEGLVAILGVPLRLGSTVIGVLMAANRSERPFARDEVTLLASLAAHAAVAIDNARLLHETRAALDELNTANQLVRAHSESVERAAAAHDRLADLVLRGGGVEDVAAAVSDVLGGALLVLDADGRVLASTAPATDSRAGAGGPPARAGHPVAGAAGAAGPPPVAGCPDEATLADAVAASRTSGRAVHAGACVVAAVAAGPEQLGALVLSGVPDLAGADQRILERAALVTALLLLFRRSAADAEERVRGELLGDLLAAPRRDPDSLRERARRLGVDLDTPHSVVAVDAGELPRQRVASYATRLAADRKGLSGSHSGRVLLMLPQQDPALAARAVAQALEHGLGSPVTAGAGGPGEGPEGVAAAHADAERCLEAMLALGRRGTGGAMADLGFLGLVLGDSRDAGGFVRRTLGPLLDYDERRGTGLLATLEQYFAHGGSLARTREVLHVHVNTVAQRLERIGRLLGDDWNTPDRALEVQLALKLHRATGAG
ncbi:MAG: helix-turn-helix domain-containing protein [Mycobacteriales bacterium]